MNIQHNDSKNDPPIFLARAARHLNPLLNFLLISVILSLVLNVLANLVSQPLQIPLSWKQYLQYTFNWGIQHPIISLLLLVILFLFRFIFFLVRDVPIPPSNKELECDYLESLEQTTEILVPEGLPTQIRGFSALLRTITHSHNFYPNTPMTDLPPKISDLRGGHSYLKNEKIWRDDDFDEDKKVNFTAIWDGLTRERPVAIIHGFPGMGKTTLLAGLTLHLVLNRLSIKRYTSERLAFWFGFHSPRTIHDFNVFHHLRPPLLPIPLPVPSLAPTRRPAPPSGRFSVWVAPRCPR